MFKKFFAFLCMTLFCSTLMAQDIVGLWKSINEKTGKPQCVVAVYEHDGIRYGRIIGTFNNQGKMDDTIYKPKGRAPGLVGDPFYCGLDLIWNLTPAGSKFVGKIVDPEKGNVYNSELWIQNDKLVVRGKLFVFGRSQEWVPATAADFPKGFKKIDTSKFVPSIPQVK